MQNTTSNQSGNHASAAAAPIRVAVIGATGLTGQQFLVALANHPYFRITHLAASARSTGKTYREAISLPSGQLAWYAAGALDPALAAMRLDDAQTFDASAVDLVFTAIEADAARALEPRYAAVCPVISTASAFRYDDDVPLLLPGINPDHAAMLAHQRAKRGWKGFIAPNPNCTTVGLAITLAPLYRAFGLERVHMVSMQSVSGAGRSPGVTAMDVIDNIIPYIPKEEGKVEVETRKILGALGTSGDGNIGVTPASFGVSCTCTRVGVMEGHTEVVHLVLGAAGADADEAEITRVWRAFGAELAAAGHPSCPPALIHVHEDPFRPQVRLDRDLGDGMTTAVGRLRRDESTARGWKYMLVSHNTKMGAAKGCVLVAEELVARGEIRAAGTK